MKQSTPKPCKTCGRPYDFDESANFHMEPPVDYRRGYQQYCLACWLGVGPMDHPELFLESRTHGDTAIDDCSLPESEVFRIRARRFRIQSSAKAMEDSKPLRASVYLWLCCEGWMRFGPFDWLRFDDKMEAILGPDGEAVARKVDQYWRVTSGRGEGMQFSDPTITTTRQHPHENRSSHPAYKP